MATSATVVPPGGGTWLGWLGHPVCYLATGEQTDGRYCLSLAVVPPGEGPPPHAHVFGEGFYVLEGELTYTAGDQTIVLPTGASMYVAPGTAHFFRNKGTTPARLLVLAAPAGFDRFQHEAGIVLTGPDDPRAFTHRVTHERLKEVGAKYGIDLDPPPEAFTVPPVVTVRQPGAGRALWVTGDLYVFLAEGADTNGTFCWCEATVPPGGGPPPHRHRREGEGFFVLEGTITFHADGQRVEAGPGTFLHAPIGVPHSFRNETQQTARVLLLVAPAGLEKMFQRVGRQADRSAPIPPMDHAQIERLVALAPEYGIELLR
jgi:quercetin dioxygenase-like cupin family protein